MPAIISHPYFTQPEELDAPIWRYMDFTKYISILEKGSLYFSRANLLGDPFEGSIPKGNVKFKTELYWNVPEHERENVINEFSEMRRRLVNKTFINCWHMNLHESAAMWRLYSKSDEAIAIKSTYRDLVNLLPEEAIIGVIEYVDYEDYIIREGNTYSPFVYKRKSFSHENEIRAVIQDFSLNENFPDGKNIPVDIHQLIKEVYVSPSSQDWYFEIVRNVSKKYEIHAPIKKSLLSEEPIF